MNGSESLGIIALVPDDWGGIVTVRHQVLRRLAKYHKVLWLEPVREWREFVRPSSARFLAADHWSQPIPSMEVLSTGCRHPHFYRPQWLRVASLRSRLASARRRLLALGATRIALYLWRDEYAEALDHVDHDFSVYHVDDEYSFSDTDKPNSAREARLLSRVDQVIVHSPALFEKKGGINPNTALIPNGVDFRLFSSPHDEPADLAPIARPRIGHAGVIKRQLDLDLLMRLARARPDWSFVLVGPIMNVSGKERQLATLQQMSNVHFPGGKPAHELPAYIQHFDVCLMCYEVNDYTRYIYPLKLHEYLATGRPAISSPIGAVSRFADVVAVAKDESEWIAAIERALGARGSDESAAQARRAVARANDWDTLVEQIAQLFAPAITAQKNHGSRLLQAS